MFQVIFTYDESCNKWEASVLGANNKQDAIDGFSAVVLTCHHLNPAYLKHSKVSDDYKITPAV